MEVDIVIRSDDGRSRTERRAVTGPMSIGRNKACSIWLDSDLVSRQHVVVGGVAKSTGKFSKATSDDFADDALSATARLGTPPRGQRLAVLGDPGQRQGLVVLSADHLAVYDYAPPTARP